MKISTDRERLKSAGNIRTESPKIVVHKETDQKKDNSKKYIDNLFSKP
jgi:hypothetical protein